MGAPTSVLGPLDPPGSHDLEDLLESTSHQSAAREMVVIYREDVASQVEPVREFVRGEPNPLSSLVTHANKQTNRDIFRRGRAGLGDVCHTHHSNSL